MENNKNITELTPLELEGQLYDLCLQAGSFDSAYIQANEEYEILEDAKKQIFAQIVDRQPQKTTAEKERSAIQTDEWRQWLIGYQHARFSARKARVQRDAAIRIWEATRSILSSRNTERRFT